MGVSKDQIEDLAIELSVVADGTTGNAEKWRARAEAILARLERISKEAS